MKNPFRRKVIYISYHPEHQRYVSFFKDIWQKIQAAWRRFYYKNTITKQREKELNDKFGCVSGGRIIRNQYGYPVAVSDPMRSFYLKHKRTGRVIVDKAFSIREIMSKYGDNYDVKEPMNKSVDTEY